MNNLHILSKEIRQLDGYHCLNDLHKAAGGEAKHQPNRFIKLTQTQALIEEIERYPNKGSGILPCDDRSPNVASDILADDDSSPYTERGNNLSVENAHIAVKTKMGGSLQGTFACKELILAYGMWINSNIYLAVLRAFLDQQESQPQQIAEPVKRPTLTPMQQRHIQNRVGQLVSQQVGTSFAGMWGSLKDEFKVGTYKDIEARKYPEVCEFLRCEPIDEAIEPDNMLLLPDGLIGIEETHFDGLVTEVEHLKSCVDAINENYTKIINATNEAICSINYPNAILRLN